MYLYFGFGGKCRQRWCLNMPSRLSMVLSKDAKVQKATSAWCETLNKRYDMSCSLETQQIYLSERYRVALGSRCLTRTHFTAKQKCRFTSHRRQRQETMTHLEAVCTSFIRYPCNISVCSCDRTDVAWNDPAEQINANMDPETHRETCSSLIWSLWGIREHLTSSQRCVNPLQWPTNCKRTLQMSQCHRVNLTVTNMSSHISH